MVLGREHISFNTTKLGSLVQVQGSKDPEGLRVFYYLVQVRCYLGRVQYIKCFQKEEYCRNNGSFSWQQQLL